MAQMKYYYELTVSSSPHVHQDVTTRTIMRDVLIALAPAMVFSVVNFGVRALLVTMVSVIACYGFEKLWNILMKQNDKTYDLSACVTGVLLAFVCPVTVAYWQIVIGAAFAIGLVKMLFGGLGRNVVNPALAGRAFMMSWPVAMSTWIKPGFQNAASIFGSADIVTAATPRANMHQGMMPVEKWTELFWGSVGGCIGETSALMLLIGLAYLLIRKVIKITIPAAYIGTVAILIMNCCVVLLDRIGRPVKFGAPVQKKEAAK